jgi:hypothetical protein
MTMNRQEQDERKREAANWLAGLAGIVAVSADGTERVLEGEEAVQAIIRQWENEPE